MMMMMVIMKKGTPVVVYMVMNRKILDTQPMRHVAVAEEDIMVKMCRASHQPLAMHLRSVIHQHLNLAFHHLLVWIFLVGKIEQVPDAHGMHNQLEWMITMTMMTIDVHCMVINIGRIDIRLTQLVVSVEEVLKLKLLRLHHLKS